MPCGHFCVCNPCATSIRLSPIQNRCPLCRSNVSDIVQLDVNMRDAEGAINAPQPAQRLQTHKPSPPIAKSLPQDAERMEQSDCSYFSPSAGEPSEAPHHASQEELRAARLRALEQQTVSSTPTHGSQEQAALVPQSVAATVPTTEALPARALQRLMREIRQIEKDREKNITELGVDLSLSDPEGNDLRLWTLRLLTSGVDAKCALGEQLRQKDVEAIEFEIWIPDGFPRAPPKVRVLRPTFSIGSFYVQAHGALCLELLSAEGWSPAASLVQLGLQIKSQMSAGEGSLRSREAMAERSDASRQQAWKVFRVIEEGHSDWRR